MDDMSLRIQEKSHLVAKYVKTNGPRLYRWGLTDSELDGSLETKGERIVRGVYLETP